MRVTVILERLQASPFRPFTFHLTDGRVYPVRHREMLSLQRSAIYLMQDEQPQLVIIDPLMVVTIEYEKADAMQLPSSYKPRPPFDEEFPSED